MIPAAVYLRVSTEEQTIESQRPDCLRVAEARGLDVTGRIYEEIQRAWAMPNARTFRIPPIKRLIEDYSIGNVGDAFPFPRKRRDALVYIRDEGPFDTLLLDPPYSPRQVVEHYDAPVWSRYLSQVRDAAALAARRVISFGWNSNGLGKGRGFKPIALLLVHHGAHHNDTICLVEDRITLEGRS